MEQKINIAEILKDCPKGMELDCTLYDNVVFDTISYGDIYPIKIKTPEHYIFLTKNGCYSTNEFSKCIIFPKGKTTWKGFQIPYEDGDIVACDAHHLQIFIFKDKKEDNTLSDCYLMLDVEDDELYLEDGMYYVTRFATEEEKKKLFDAIKENGYNWNEETKTLEKLVNPRFKIGNRIKYKINQYEYTIIDITKDNYIVRYKTDKFDYHVPFWDEDNYDLVPDKFDITTLIPFESRVLMRSSNAREWVATFYSHYSNNKFYGCGMCCDQCIPYEKNEHLLGTTNDCDEYFKTW